MLLDSSVLHVFFCSFSSCLGSSSSCLCYRSILALLHVFSKHKTSTRARTLQSLLFCITFTTTARSGSGSVSFPEGRERVEDSRAFIFATLSRSAVPFCRLHSHKTKYSYFVHVLLAAYVEISANFSFYEQRTTPRRAAALQ